MKLLITGSRNFNDKEKLFKELSEISFDTLISGGAKGADQMAEEYAVLNGITVEQHKPDYKKYGRAAPIVRNKDMVELSDSVIAFWDGKSKGTKSTIDYSKKLNKIIKIVIFNE